MDGTDLEEYAKNNAELRIALDTWGSTTPV